jgi:two-component sensor histidine kinase
MGRRDRSDEKMKTDDDLKTDVPSISGEQLLIREILHRINNDLASIIGLISLTAARSTSDDVKAALHGVVGLLQEYARLQRALEKPAANSPVDVTSYLRVLCQAIRRTRLDQRGIELVFAEHSFQMGAEQCWKFGLILSELIMNSARHAFHQRGGRIKVELTSSGLLAQCRVVDNGSSRGPRSPGQGLAIVDELARSLNGRIVHRFGEEGAMSVLTFPVATGALADERH